MAEDFNVALCDQKHEDMERRMAHIETTLSNNLDKLYGKIEEISGDLSLIALKRQPIWVTAVISFLSATCVGLIVAIVK